MITLESRNPSFGRVLSNRYNIAINWNSHGAYYVATITDKNDKGVVYGIPLIMGKDLLQGFKRNNEPSGSLVLVSSKGNRENPNYDNLHEYRLSYVV